MRILITGGLGHIGSALISLLDNDVCQITVVDDLSSERYCTLFEYGSKITFIRKRFIAIDQKVLNRNDVVIHLAAVTNASKSFDNDELWNTNVIETKKFIDNVACSKVKLFLFPSSTSVYGKSKVEMYEDGDNLDPQSPYADGKLVIENYLKQCAINYLIYRFGTIFGTSIGMRFHTAINKFCFQAVYNEPLTVWKENYKQVRPYLGIKDAIQSMILGMHNKKMWDNTFNVLSCNTKLCDIIQYIKSIIRINVNFVDTPLLNQHSYFVNYDKIKAYDYKVQSDICKGINDTINFLGGKNG
jgi:nucleoside-diphosphate-sugar epimerase